MRTVHEVSKLTGVSIRTLQYYDKIGLLKPTEYTESGYRLYDDTALEALQQILLFRELEFPLKEINKIISTPDFNKNVALEQQITLLTMKKERLEKLIDFAREIQLKGEKVMDFTVFDTKKIDEYAKKAKEQWGKTEEYREFEQKARGRNDDEEREVMKKFMEIFVEFGKLKDSEPDTADVQNQVQKLQDYITKNFYQCSKEILGKLGRMYAECGEFTENIDKAGGAGTAQFTAKAVEIFCGR